MRTLHSLQRKKQFILNELVICCIFLLPTTSNGKKCHMNHSTATMAWVADVCCPCQQRYFRFWFLMGLVVAGLSWVFSSISFGVLFEKGTYHRMSELKPEKWLCWVTQSCFYGLYKKNKIIFLSRTNIDFLFLDKGFSCWGSSLDVAFVDKFF